MDANSEIREIEMKVNLVLKSALSLSYKVK